jgi:carbon-monoxide dehydrogenase medium subunit
VALANGGVGRVGIAMTGVGPINIRAEAAEAALAGRPLDDDAIAEAGRLAAEAAEPLADVRGSVEYKKNAIRVLTERGLRRAVEAAREQPRDDNEQFAGHETVEGVMNEIEEKDQ